MRIIIKFSLLAGVGVITCFLTISGALGYDEEEAGEAIVEGKILFKGEPPPPRLFSFGFHSRGKYCSQFDNDGHGNRILREVTVNDEKLQDVVVYIKNIEKGKPFVFKRTEVKINGCRFLVQGGPSKFVGVVVNGGLIKITNFDADSNDPIHFAGVLHHPHSYEKLGSSSSTIFNLPLITKGDFIEKKVKLRKEKKGSIFYLESVSNRSMQAYFYPIQNPYYAIVGPEGTYSIDKIPPGNYTILAWHPILGTQKKEIGVGSTDKVTVNFEFNRKPPKSLHPNFSQDLVSKLRPGIPLPKVEEMFGVPDSRYSTLCGSEEKKWCNILVYIIRDEDGNYWSEKRFYFKDIGEKTPTLTHWIFTSDN